LKTLARRQGADEEQDRTVPRDPLELLREVRVGLAVVVGVVVAAHGLQIAPIEPRFEFGGLVRGLPVSRPLGQALDRRLPVRARDGPEERRVHADADDAHLGKEHLLVLGVETEDAVSHLPAAGDDPAGIGQRGEDGLFEAGIGAERVLDAAAVGIDDVGRIAGGLAGDDRLIDEMVGVQDIDRVPAQDLAHDRHVEIVIGTQLLVAQGGERADVALALLVGQEHGPDIAVRELVDDERAGALRLSRKELAALPLGIPRIGRASGGHVLGARLAAQHVDVVALAGQCPREIARVLVAARAGQLVPVVDADPHREGIGKRSARV
jgi:hypothetical protein